MSTPTKAADETIDQHARREAHQAWIYGRITMDQRAGYAAALIAERSKPQPSVEEVMDCVEASMSDERGDFNYEILDRTSLRDRLNKLFNK